MEVRQQPADYSKLKSRQNEQACFAGVGHDGTAVFGGQVLERTNGSGSYGHDTALFLQCAKRSLRLTIVVYGRPDRNAVRLAKGLEAVCPPPSTMTGALLDYVSAPSTGDFQPMNANFGILRSAGRDREARAGAALSEMKAWINANAKSGA